MSYAKIIIPIFLSLILIFSYAMDGNADTDWDQIFDEQIINWITEIAIRNTRYSSWLGAKWSSQSFGPNSRQWLIHIYEEDSVSGYMIIGENEAGHLQVNEYGLGEIELTQ